MFSFVSGAGVPKKYTNLVDPSNKNRREIEWRDRPFLTGGMWDIRFVAGGWWGLQGEPDWDLKKYSSEAPDMLQNRCGIAG